MQQAISVICYQGIYYICPHPADLREAELNGNGQINLLEPISKKFRFQTVAWLQLAAFRKVCTDNWIQKIEYTLKIL